LQFPVAKDLRIVLASTYCAEKVERMGDLAARFAHPSHAVLAELESTFADLGQVTAGMADRLTEMVTAPAAGAFAELEATDHRVDQVHATLPLEWVIGRRPGGTDGDGPRSQRGVDPRP
jgi:phosphate transport system protein